MAQLIIVHDVDAQRMSLTIQRQLPFTLPGPGHPGCVVDTLAAMALKDTNHTALVRVQIHNKVR